MKAVPKPESARGAAGKAILEAAIDLVREGGLEAASSRAIAARSGQNVALINYYYSSKESLLDAALESLLSGLALELREAVGAQRAGRTDGQDPLGRFCGTYALFLRENAAFLREVFARVLDGRGAPGVIGRFVSGEGLAGLGALLGRGKEGGHMALALVSALMLPALAPEAVEAISGLDLRSPEALRDYALEVARTMAGAGQRRGFPPDLA